MTNAQNDLKDFAGKIESVIRDAAAQNALRPVAEKAIDIIRKRTRLGYGVPNSVNGTADRFKLQALSPGYIKLRQKSHLSDQTSAKRSNLTFTGQLLDSLAVIRIIAGSVIVGPTGTRKGESLTNAQLAGYLAEKGRPFLSLSKPEAEQLRRFYRNTFGDLLKNKRLKK